MPGARRRIAAAAVAAAAAALAAAPAAGAHITLPSGPYRVELGWGSEPAISGSENFVDVGITGASGGPAAGARAALQVEVSFGAARTTLPLVPGEAPGRFRAVLVPTRPGGYAFHVTGTLDGRAIDVRAACSERTFDCVTPASEVQFPVKAPSSGELAQRVERELPRAERAADSAQSAKRVAVAALVVAALALAGAVTLAVRGRRKRTG